MPARAGGPGAAPRLTIDALAPDRPYVSLFGTDYYYLHPDELSLLDEARYRRLEREFRALEAEESRKLADDPDYETDDETIQRITVRLRDLVKIIVADLPREVIEGNGTRELPGLTDRHCMAILEDFNEAQAFMPRPLALKHMRAAPAAKTRKRPTGG